MRPKLLFFPFALIVFVWSFVGFTKPAWTEYQDGKDQLKKLSAEKQTLAQGVSNIKKSVVEFQQLGDDGKKMVYNSMPLVINNDNLVAEINKGASQSGVMVIKIATKKSINKSAGKCSTNISGVKNNKSAKKEGTACAVTATPINVSMSVVGTYPMIKDFLNKLDTQNRVIVPQSLSLSSVSNQRNDKDKQAEEVISLVNAKINFDVFQKERNDKIVLSKVLDKDSVLKSLLIGGLSKKGLQALQNMVTSEVFYPVTADGAGKEDLFKQTAKPVEAVQ